MEQLYLAVSISIFSQTNCPLTNPLRVSTILGTRVEVEIMCTVRSFAYCIMETFASLASTLCTWLPQQSFMYYGVYCNCTNADVKSKALFMAGLHSRQYSGGEDPVAQLHHATAPHGN